MAKIIALAVTAMFGLAGFCRLAAAADAPAVAAKPAPNAQKLFAEAFDLLNADRPNEAAAKFEAGLKVDPKNVMAWFYLGEAQFKAGLQTQAAAAYRKSLALNPSSDVAPQANERLATLPAAPAASSSAMPVAKTAGGPPKDPAAVTLPSGITMADWELYAEDQVKLGKQDKILQEGHAYRQQYGNVAHLDEILNAALESKLSAMRIDSAADARKVLPELTQLAVDFPNSLATVYANGSRGLIALDEAEERHSAGDFDGALAGYRTALGLLPPRDDRRKLIVEYIENAQNHEKFSNSPRVSRVYQRPLPPEVTALGPVLQDLVKCMGDLGNYAQDYESRTEGTWSATAAEALRGKSYSTASSYNQHEHGISRWDHHDPSGSTNYTIVSYQTPMGTAYSLGVMEWYDHDYGNSSSTTTLDRIVCEQPIFPLRPGTDYSVTWVTKYASHQDQARNTPQSATAFTTVSKQTFRMTKALTSAEVRSELPWLHLVGADADNWRVTVLDRSYENSYQDLSMADNAKQYYKPSNGSDRIFFVAGPNVFVSDQSKDLQPGWTTTITQQQ